MKKLLKYAVPAAWLAMSGHAYASLEEIVVTAQKRSENIQRVPIAISAFTANALKERGISGTDNLGEITPGLIITHQQQSAVPYLRGIGSQAGGTAGDESSVAIYIDGVYVFQPEDIFFSFNNVDRVEVLKGPQGTLYGRNAVGGAINIITRTPAQKPSIDASIGYGNYNTRELKFYGTTGITKKLAADIAGYQLDQLSGWGKNLVTGGSIDQMRDEGLRTKWVYQASDATKLTFAADYTRRHSDEGVVRHPLPGTFNVSGAAGFVGDYNVQQDNKSDYYVTQMGASLRLDQDLDWAKLVDIVDFHSTRSLMLIDQDGGPAKFLNVRAQIPGQDYSEEIQLLAPNNSPIKWILGAFYMHGYDSYKPEALTGILEGGPNKTFNTFATEGVDSRAAFGQATAAILPGYNLTLGLRYTSDKRTAVGFNQLPTGAVQAGSYLNTSKTFDKVSWRLALDHRFSDNVLGYISDNRGFKSGVFNITAISQGAVRPEVLDAYEIGLKSELFEHRVRLNLAGFYYNDRDIQLTRNFGTFTALYNAAQGQIFGVDLDTNVQLAQGLKLQGGLEYLDPTYVSFPGAPATTSKAPLPGNINSAINASGNQMIHASPLVFNIGVTYIVPVPVGQLVMNGSYYYNDGFYWEPDNRVREPSYGLLDASITWNSPDDRYAVTLWGKNLTNQRYDTWFSSSALGDQAAPGAPLTFGGTIEFRI